MNGSLEERGPRLQHGRALHAHYLGCGFRCLLGIRRAPGRDSLRRSTAEERNASAEESSRPSSRAFCPGVPGRRETGLSSSLCLPSRDPSCDQSTNMAVHQRASCGFPGEAHHVTEPALSLSSCTRVIRLRPQTGRALPTQARLLCSHPATQRVEFRVLLRSWTPASCVRRRSFL